jgi:hypothetical protein
MSEPLKPQPPDPNDAHPGGPLTHWVDTNVMLEVYSHGDLYEAHDAWERGEGRAAAIEERRVRMQSSLWMAMALCRVGARSMTFTHENLRNIRRLAPPDSTRGAWTSAILYVLADGGVFEGWERHTTNDGVELTNRQRDAHMIQACRTGGLVLITHDAQVIDEAQAVGVDAAKPETFAARYLTREDARRMFDERRRDAAARYLVAGTPQEQTIRMRVNRTIGDVYGGLWQPLDQPWTP